MSTNKCEHDVNKYQCYKCKHQYKCSHGKQCYTRCRQCLGHPINDGKCSRCKKPFEGEIVDGKLLKTCKECRYHSDCPHGYRIKKRCKECSKELREKYLCTHTKRRGRCRECFPHNYCLHELLKESCIICNPRCLCIHGTRKDYCRHCSPNSKYYCTSCRLFRVTKQTNYLCSYCNPDKTKTRKTKENRVRDLLLKNDIKFTQDKILQNNCCLRYRPDFVIDCGSYWIVLECDEYAHSQYDRDCEIIRMNNVSTIMGLPVKWIRYNPDVKGVKITEKEKVLMKTLREHLDKTFLEDLSVVYLFYPESV